MEGVFNLSIPSNLYQSNVILIHSAEDTNMEAKNIRQPSVKRNQINEKVTTIKDGPSTKLSGLTLRARNRAPLAEISTNNGTNNFELQGGPIITNKAGVSSLISEFLYTI